MCGYADHISLLLAPSYLFCAFCGKIEIQIVSSDYIKDIKY